MTDRFDLEQQMLDCWRVTDDVKLLCENVCDNDLSTDDVANALIGIETLYNMKFQKMWNTFEILIRQDHFKRQEENEYVLEKQKLIEQIKSLKNGFVQSAEYTRGYEHGRDDSVTIIETS